MADLPGMMIFGDAYMADTRHLSLEEHGAYYLLLLIAWRCPERALPDDDKRLAQMLGITAPRWAKLKPTIMAFWNLDERGWTQKRQLKAWEIAQNRSEKAADAAHKRWGTKSLKTHPPANADADAYAHAPAMQPKPYPYTKEDKPLSSRAKRKPKLPISPDWLPKPFGAETKAAGILEQWDEHRYQREVEAFKAHHGSRANCFSDWQQAWATWVLNSEQFDRSGRNGADKQTANRTTAAAVGAFGHPGSWRDDEPF